MNIPNTSTMRYMILDNKGVPHTLSRSLDTVMEIMATRWAGKVIEISSNSVLFDIETDRNCKKQYPNAKEQRDETTRAYEKRSVER